MKILSFTELIVNTGFETGAFPPWLQQNAIITSQYRHSGFFAAQLEGDAIGAFVVQFLPIPANQRFEFIVSLAKVGAAPNAQVLISVEYYDINFNYIGAGLTKAIAPGALPDVTENNWLEIYEITDVSPAATVYADVLISRVSEAGTADIVVDDVSLVAVEGGGATGPTGPAGATGLTGATGPTGPTGEVVLAFGSLRGASSEAPGATFTPVPFSVVGPLSATITVSLSGNELVVGESGIYQITISINAEATTDPDPDEPYLNAIITVNGTPIFGDTTTFFKISNRSSSTFVVQASLTAEDEVGVSINTDFPALGYANRSLTIVQLSN